MSRRNRLLLSAGLVPLPWFLFWTSVAALFASALLAMVRELVDDDGLLHANATIDIAFEIGFILGIPLSGVLMMIASPAAVLLITAILLASALSACCT